MKHEIKKKDFLPTPEYEGGPKALSAFIYQQLKYPLDALTKKIEGTVVIKAEINHRGEVIDTKMISGIGLGCDEEAMRVIKLLKFKIAKVRNIKVRFYKTFNIQFKLQNSMIDTSVKTVKYVYLEKQNSSSKSEEKKSTIIQYNILFPNK
ncbi:MAG: TonB family protein [Saprospiraceae bacterium]|nr:TonB family protein [Saprospiraceae bacterium]MBK8483904.1 TonB family protein [Saprospiraceae bacterium]MBK9221311.1 TonB family protein [Saprospiraceae bacterium]MBK9721754.1 TonB family protein [Saprospiraceae bacterium]